MVLVVRVDVSTEIGTGHLMRCLALAQAWQDKGGRVFIVMTEIPLAFNDRLMAEEIKLFSLVAVPGSADDALKTAELAHQVGASWVVVDGYHFGATYQQAIKEQELRLLVIDDYGHSDRYYADIVLNQNIYAGEGLYKHREAYTRLLLGTGYALLRREFRSWAHWSRDIPETARKVLVTLGGADQDNVTRKVIHALQLLQIEGLEALVVAGASNLHIEQLRSAAEGTTVPIRVVTNVTNLTELMAWADVAVSAGGSTCWELAFMGLPSIILVVADNQLLIAEQLGNLRVAKNLGWHNDVSPAEISSALHRLLSDSSLRSLMSERGRDLVDGKGANRIANILTM